MEQDDMQIADLNDEQVAKLKAFEAETGKVIVALTPRYKIASLDIEHLARLQKLERELDVVLMAYENA